MVDFYDVSPPEPDPCPCEAIDCELWDWVKDKCREDHEPGDCPELRHMDKSERDDREYHKRVDEGEMR